MFSFILPRQGIDDRDIVMFMVILGILALSTDVRTLQIPEGCTESCSCDSKCNVCLKHPIPVLCLKGTHFEMGKFYGAILGNELQQVLSILKDYFTVQRNISWEWLQTDAITITNRWSYGYISYLKGIAAVTNLTEKDVYILNAGSPMYSDSFIAWCLFAFIPPSKSETRKSFALRNFDLGAPWHKVSQYLVVTTLVEPNLIPTTFASFAGQIYCQTCWNEKGLFMQLNNGMASGGFEANYNRQNILSNMLYMMQNSDTLDRLSNQLMATTTDYSLIINIANATTTKSFEMGAISFWGTLSPDIPRDHVFVSTNYFQHPDWHLYQQISWNTTYIPDDVGTWFGVTRRKNMLRMLEPSNHSRHSLKKVMDKNEGGAKWYTVYQVIWDSAEYEILIKRTNYDTEWIRIKMWNYYSDK